MKREITLKNTVLGVELGSTRIKAVLCNEAGKVLASGSYEWENKYINGLWTYSQEDILCGLQKAYKSLKTDVKEKYGEILTETGAMGISAMMHGYLVFDNNNNLLVPFRTWRNNNAEPASRYLTEKLNYNVPARWSISHLYQAIINGEEHIKDIAFQTTLAGYVHYQLTGEKVLGIDDASGVFPIDSNTKDYDEEKIKTFEGILQKRGVNIQLRKIFPKVLCAGECAGKLTKEGALLLDPEGDLQEGIALCPPEGDAATGMVATNSVKVRTGNVSAGTSIFGMVVMEKDLSAVHPEIDIVTTPTGDPVAMVHCNNCTSDVNAWMNIFSDFAQRLGVSVSQQELYKTLFESSLEGDADCGEVLSYNYVSGENITGVTEGRPLLVRKTESNFNLPNFMRSQLYATMATLKIGTDILLSEDVKIDKIVGHGGLFKTDKVCQQYLADAICAPVTVMENAGEGGPWGMALLALYLKNGSGESLSDFIEQKIFQSAKSSVLSPSKDVEGMQAYIEKYRAGIDIVKKAVEVL